jgi:hypothetical protein
MAVTVTENCVSITAGTLSPDKRVDYAYGMVLGLGEFLQEQQYFLQKDYLHERALHGYGTVYGLQVMTAPATDDPGDYTITVTPGMAIDQWGREVLVRCAQCARLGEWLAAQEQADPGVIALHAGVSGEYTVYAVAKYAQCEDDLVPLPGQPCSSSAQTSVPSRIRDAWDVELRWAPPAMPAWDIDRELARLLRVVQIVPGLDPTLSSEAEITAAVADLGDQLTSSLPAGPVLSPSDEPSGGGVWRLPAETAGEALDRILTVWVTQVRPVLWPWLTQPPDSSDASILLSTIDFTLGPQTSSPGIQPMVASCSEPVDEGRPYVLHTRLIQELLLLGGGDVTTVAAAAQELATLTSSVDAGGRLILTAWFHLDQPVALTEPIQVRSRSGTYGSFDPSTGPDPSGVNPQFSDVWILTPTSEFPVIDADEVEVTISADSTYVADFATSLRTYRAANTLDFVGSTPTGDVLLYGEVDVPAAAQAPPVTIPPLLDFVTFTPLGDGPIVEPVATLQLQLWFHPQPAWPSPRAVITELPSGLVQVFDELTQQRLPAASQPVTVGPNVWDIAVRAPQPLDLNTGTCLRVVFQIGKIIVTIDGGEQLTLPQWMQKAGINFVNADAAGRTITAYYQTRAVQKQ